MKKRIAVILAVVLLVCVAVGATIAWLTDTTQKVENTFTVSDIDIKLEESDSDDPDTDVNVNSYKMIPGWTIEKDPVVTVLAGSEDAYLFVKVEKSTNFDTYMSYTMADGWTLVPGETNVYYREVAASDADQPFAVIKDNTITVKDTITEEMMDGLIDDTYPTLDVTAYAIQLYKANKPALTKFQPDEAWDLVK